MKIVLKIGMYNGHAQRIWVQLANVIAALRGDGHGITLIHGGNYIGHGRRQHGRTGRTGGRQSAVSEIQQETSKLVAALAKAGVPAIGLSGADGYMVRTRKVAHTGGAGLVEVASLNAAWMDLLSRGGGVPVLANVALGLDGVLCCVDPNQMAAECARAWNAHALIFLTRSPGVKDVNGSVIRWLEAAHVDPLVKAVGLTPSMCSKLRACRSAIQGGVARARIFPVDQVESLASFYFSRLDYGTEVVSRVNEPLSLHSSA